MLVLPSFVPSSWCVWPLLWVDPGRGPWRRLGISCWCWSVVVWGIVLAGVSGFPLADHSICIDDCHLCVGSSDWFWLLAFWLWFWLWHCIAFLLAFPCVVVYFLLVLICFLPSVLSSIWFGLLFLLPPCIFPYSCGLWFFSASLLTFGGVFIPGRIRSLFLWPFFSIDCFHQSWCVSLVSHPCSLVGGPAWSSSCSWCILWVIGLFLPVGCW